MAYVVTLPMQICKVIFIGRSEDTQQTRYCGKTTVLSRLEVPLSTANEKRQVEVPFEFIST